MEQVVEHRLAAEGNKDWDRRGNREWDIGWNRELDIGWNI